jgi:drug/metabolite transporter (DMT)-like permease
MMIPAVSLAAAAMGVGLVMLVPLLIWSGVPRGLDGSSVGWLAVGGAANVVAFLLAYSAFGRGKVGAVTPIISTEGAFAAIFAVAGGERLGVGVAVALAVIAAGVIVAALPDPETAAQGSHDPKALMLALASAVGYGLGLYGVGRASKGVPIVWVLLPARLIGAVLVTLPMALRGRLIVTRRAFPYVVGLALFEMLGLALYSDGARDSLAVTAVLASQFAALATLAAAIFFRERLARRQVAGLVTIAVGVAVLSGLHP